MPKPPWAQGELIAPEITAFGENSGGIDDNLTNDSTPTLTGTSDPGIEVRLFANGVLLGTTTADDSGNWSFTTGVLTDGSYSFTAETGKGSHIVTSDPFDVVIDTTTPDPEITSAVEEAAGGVRLEGTAEAGASVDIYRDGVLIGTVIAEGGSWEFLDENYAGGTVTYTAVATDLADNSAERSIRFPNAAPSITSPAAVSVAENQTLALDVSASDDNDSEGAGLAYAVTGGADAALFAIDPATGTLSFLAAPDYENPADADGDNAYQVQVTVSDSGGLTDVQDITVTVTDAPENAAPSITSPAAVSVAENQTLALDVSASDDNDSEGAGLAYAITGGADAALFAIDPATG
ncbi:Ig-like domain-containing protein, partial [Tropicimonas sediminicola]